MKRSKKLIILLLILTAFGIATIFINNMEEDKITANESEVLSIDIDNISEISWKIDGETISLYKSEDAWHTVNDENFPIDEDKLEEILLNLSSVISTFKIEDISDYSPYGLDNPTCIINVITDTTTTIKLGNYSEMDSQRYVSINDTVYLLKEDIYDAFNVSINDLMKVEEIPSLSTITSVVMSGKNQIHLIYEKDSNYCYTNEYVYFLKENNQYYPVDDSQAAIFMNYIRNLEWNGVTTYNLSEDELSTYNLDDPDFTIQFNYVENDEDLLFIIYISKKGSKYYARIDESKYVYEIDVDTYTALEEENYDHLRPDEILNLDWDLVERLEIEMNDQTYLIEVSGKSSDLKYEYLDERIEFDGAVTQLNSLTISEFNNESSSKKIECSITIYQDKENHEEIVLDFYQVDGENCLIQFNGETLGYVNRSDVVDFMEEVNKIILAF